MKKIVTMLLLGASLAACSRVEPGHVGVKVNSYGSGAGVENKALGIGTYWTGFGSTIYEYPIFTSNYAWTNGAKCEGSGDDRKCDGTNEEYAFQDRNGLVVQADVATAYRVDPTKAPILFQKYRTDMDGILAGPVRNAVRSALVDQASNMSVEEIYGPKKSVLIAKALGKVRAYFEPQGLHIEQLYWAGPIRIPPAILERINARAQNEQAAIAAQAQVATVEAEGRAAVAKAQALAAAKIAQAEGDAKATQVRNAAIAQNPGYQSEWVRKWDGQLPKTVYCSSDKPCVTVEQ